MTTPPLPAKQTMTRHHHPDPFKTTVTHKPLLPVTLIIIITLLVSACGEKNANRPDGAELKFVSAGAVNTLYPQGTSWLHDFRIIECLYEPLLKVRPDNMQLEFAAASDYTVSDDGLTYTFTIRPDARWSNGDPLLASDFVFAWQRNMLPDSAANYAGLTWCIKGAREFLDWRTDQLDQFNRKPSTTANAGVSPELHLWHLTERKFNETVGLESLDEHTLRITLEQPTPYFPELCAFATFMPVHEKSAIQALHINPDTAMVAVNSTYFNQPDKIVCNGPYTLADWQFKQKITLEKNPLYWNAENVRCDRIIQLTNNNPTGALLQYETGEVDWLPDIPTATQTAAELVRRNRPDVHTTPAAGTYFYRFNCRPRVNNRPNPLANPKLRRALAMAIDRKSIVERVTRMNQPIAVTFIPPGCMPGYTPPVSSGCRYDPDQARILLKEAGYDTGGEITGLAILYNNEGGHEGPAQAIKNMWETELGIRVALEGIELNRFSQRLRNGDFTIARSSWFGDYRDPTTFLDMMRTGDGNNDSGYTNLGFDQLLDQAAVERNIEIRMQILQAAEALMLKDQPITPIYQYINLDLFKPDRIKNLHPNPWNYRRLEWIQIHN